MNNQFILDNEETTKDIWVTTNPSSLPRSLSN